MATEIGNLRASLSANSAQFEQDMKRARNAVRKNAKGMERSMAGVSRQFKASAASIAAFAGVASVGAVFSSVARQQKEFASAISDLSAITGATGKDLEYFKRQAMDLGKTTTFSAQQVAVAFKLIASAKPDLLANKQALTEVTKQVLTLAEAARMDLPDAAKALTGALNMFGASADEAGRYINVLAAGSKYGSSEITDTAEAMKNAGSVASMLGLSFEEANAAIQVLAKGAIKGGEAGNKLKNVLLNMTNYGKNEFNPQIVGMAKAFENLKKANMDVTEQTKLFGKENINAGVLILNNIGLLDDLTTAVTGTSVAYEQARINTDNLEGDLKRLDSAWSAIALTAGGEFNSAMRSVIQLMTEAAKVAESIALAINGLGDDIAAFAAMTKALATGEIEQAKAIYRMNQEAIKQRNDKLDSIWAEVDATEQATSVVMSMHKMASDAANKALAVQKRAQEEIAAAAEEQAKKQEATAEKQQKSRAALIESLEMELNTLGLTSDQLAAYKIRLMGGTEAQAEFVASLAKSVEAKKAAIKTAEDQKKAESDAAEEAKRLNEALVAQGQAVTESVMTPMEQYTARVKELDDLLAAGVISHETYSRAVADAWKNINKSTKEESDEMSEFVKQAASNMQNAMADGFFDLMQGNISDMGENFKKTLDRMVANMLASQLNNWLFGNTAETGVGSGALGGIFDLFGGGRATGGPVSSGKMYEVNERGAPELLNIGSQQFLMMGNQGGRVTPMDSGMVSSAGGGVSVSVNVYGVKDEGGLRKTSDQIAQRSGLAVQRAIARNG